MATTFERLYRLTVDANQAVRELKKLNQSTARMQKGMAKLGRVVGTLGAALATHFSVQQVRNAIQFGDALANTADKVGVSVEALQSLRFAAEQTGVSTNTLDMALQRFARRSGEAAKGSGELVKVYKELGISLTDSNGSLKTTEALLREYAEAIKGAATPSEQLRLAFKGFDSEGAALVNMLRSGADGMDELAAAARDAGVIMEEGTARKAQVLERRVDRLSSVIKTKLLSVTIETTSAIAKLFGVYTEVDDIQPAIDKIVGQMEAMGERINRERSSWFGSSGVADELQKQMDMLAQSVVDLVGQRTAIVQEEAAAIIVELSEIEVSGKRMTDTVGAGYRKLAEDIKDAVDPAREFYREMGKVDVLVKQGFLDVDIAGEFKKMLIDAEFPVVEVTAKLRPDVDMDDFNSKILNSMDEIKNAVDGFVSDFTNTLVDGLMTGELKFKDFAKNVLATITKMMLNKVFEQFFSMLLGGGAGGGGILGAISGQPNSLVATPALAGLGPLLAGPARMNVGVLKSPTYGYSSGGGRSGGFANVVINNNAPVEVETSQRQGPQGLTLEVMVEQQVNRAIAGGGLDRAMRSAYGAKRRAF